MKDEATKKVIQYGIDQLKEMYANKEGVEATELHNRLYNQDYFIIGTWDAKNFCNQYYGGALDAVAKIVEYEKDNFGEVTTDLSDAEKVANMLAYILGEEALNNSDMLQHEWDNGELIYDELLTIAEELEAQL